MTQYGACMSIQYTVYVCVCVLVLGDDMVCQCVCVSIFVAGESVCARLSVQSKIMRCIPPQSYRNSKKEASHGGWGGGGGGYVQGE